MQRLYEKCTPMELAKRADLIGDDASGDYGRGRRSCARVDDVPTTLPEPAQPV